MSIESVSDQRFCEFVMSFHLVPSALTQQQRAYIRDQVGVNHTGHFLCSGIELSRLSNQIRLPQPARASRTVQVRPNGSLGTNKSRVLVEDHR